MATERDMDLVINKFISPKVTDNVYNARPMLQWFRKHAKLRGSYGVRIDEPLLTAKGKGGSYQDMEVIPHERNEELDRAYFYLKQYYAQLTVSWKDKLTMRGPEDVVGLLKVKAQNGLPLQVLSSTMQPSPALLEEQVAVVKWPWSEDEAPSTMSLDEQLAVLLGRRLVGSDE